jgi:oxygen-independent coproporphyrinogen III oxidase
MKALEVDLDLIRKYNVPAPRYTSYPPATHFGALPERPILERIRKTAASSRDLSIYFHLPFCHSLCWYCGCTTVITSDPLVSRRYIDYLRRELDLMSDQIGTVRNVVQLHFGGGTPTFLQPAELRELGRAIRDHFHFDADIEAGVEIDPRGVTLDHIAALRETGFNRASVGVQDFDPKVQMAVHRIQPKEETMETIRWLRATGFQSLNIDLMYGLPHQTVASFSRTLNEVIEMRPDRLAVFNYAHVPWIKPAQNLLKQLPAPEVKLELLKLTIERLTACGYTYIGMDHFARHDDELAVAQRNKTLQRNFQGYSTRADTDLFGFGMSSISQVRDAYWQNIKDIPKYYQSLDRGEFAFAKGYVLTPDDQIRREVISRLMCDLSLDFDAISKRISVDFKDYFADELDTLDELQADGLLEVDSEELRVTETGRLLIRNIAMRLTPA